MEGNLASVPRIPESLENNLLHGWGAAPSSSLNFCSSCCGCPLVRYVRLFMAKEIEQMIKGEMKSLKQAHAAEVDRFENKVDGL